MSLKRRGADIRSGTGSYADWFYPLFEYLFEEDGDFVADVERKLAEARMTDTAELYISKGLGVGVIAGLALWGLGLFVGYILFVTGVIPTESLLGVPIEEGTIWATLSDLFKIPALVGITGFFFGAIGFFTGFGGIIAIPYTRANSREREINMLLPDAVSFMYALSIGGLNQLEILDAMAKADDTYGEVAMEFRAIVQETEYFDTDYRTAIRNRALETPSDELSQFLTDMLSIINSGGDMEDFLDDKKEAHLRTAKQQQELTLETLELFGEMYMTLSLFPLLLIIILVIMGMLGRASTQMLYGTVYGLIPLTGAGFLVLVSTVKEDEPGDGYLQRNDRDEEIQRDPSLTDLGLVERFTGDWSVFDRVRRREFSHVAGEVVSAPHLYFRDNPSYTLALTVPLTLLIFLGGALSGSVPLSWDAMIGSPVWGTFFWVYVPLYVVGLPLAIFREWNVRSRRNITANLSPTLRKLSSANDTGLTLTESIKTVADTSSGKLAREFEVLHAKVKYGMGMREALVEFNNKYHVPRLARTVKLISKAQEASSQITEVLSTAAQASENQDDIERERRSRTRMQVVIILMTFLTLLAVMAILKTQFLDVMSGLSGQAGDGGGAGPASFSGGIDVSLLSLLFFHAVTMQAILSGLIAGYIRDAQVMSGLKFMLGLATVSLATWMVVG
jgi:flagellar protein FlaJ